MLSKIIVAASLLAASGVASAATTILDFSGAICGVAGDTMCSDSAQIGQNYGDGPNVDVSYRSFITSTGATFEPYLKYWANNYGDLTGVVWGGANRANYTAEITLTPGAGYELSLTSLDIATYFERSQSTLLSISTIGGTLIYAGSPSTGVPLHNSFAVASAYVTDGIVLRWGPDSYDVGLDNISFDVRSVGAGAVPEPESWVMLIAGFGLVGAVARRRGAQTAHSA